VIPWRVAKEAAKLFNPGEVTYFFTIISIPTLPEYDTLWRPLRGMIENGYCKLVSILYGEIPYRELSRKQKVEANLQFLTLLGYDPRGQILRRDWVLHLKKARKLKKLHTRLHGTQKLFLRFYV
jgi:hypothetical protein